MKKRRVQVLFFAAIFVLWEAAVRFFAVPQEILPAPSEIAVSFFEGFRLLADNGAVTAIEVAAGFGLGFLAAAILSIAAVRFRILEETIFPVILVFHALPKVAIAALLLIPLGFGYLPKIVISGLMCFFPVLICFTKGLKSTDPELLELAAVYRATEREIFWRIRIPSALPDLFTGLEAAASLSVSGALIGELVGSHQGLFYLLLQADSSSRTPLAFAALACMGILVVSLYSLVRIIKKKVIGWHISQSKKTDTVLFW